MTYPYPTAVGRTAGGGAGAAPVAPQYLVGDYVADAGAVLAVWGGVTLTADTRVWRAYITGPAGTTCRVYVTDQQPARAIPDARYLVASTPAGIEDEAFWERGLLIPAGWFLVFAWTGGLVGWITTGLKATVRMETQQV